MSNHNNPTSLSLLQQADIIRNTGILVAERVTKQHLLQLYALNDLFVEISFTMSSYWKSVNEIKYLNTTRSLQSYLDEIDLKLC